MFVWIFWGGGVAGNACVEFHGNEGVENIEMGFSDFLGGYFISKLVDKFDFIGLVSFFRLTLTST